MDGPRDLQFSGFEERATHMPRHVPLIDPETSTLGAERKGFRGRIVCDRIVRAIFLKVTDSAECFLEVGQFDSFENIMSERVYLKLSIELSEFRLVIFSQIL